MRDGVAELLPRPFARTGLSWIRVAPDAPYFLDEEGAPWTPIGDNEAISWPTLEGLFRRRDVASVERSLLELRAQGVTCLRVMLEYAQVRHRYFERGVGVWSPGLKAASPTSTPLPPKTRRSVHSARRE